MIKPCIRLLNDAIRSAKPFNSCIETNSRCRSKPHYRASRSSPRPSSFCPDYFGGIPIGGPKRAEMWLSRCKRPRSRRPMPQPKRSFGSNDRFLETIAEPGTRLHDLRIVDQERLIVCGERVDSGSATSRRFVRLSQLRQVVTDDGGPDFAILVHVCNPPAPAQVQPLSPKRCRRRQAARSCAEF